MVNLSKHSRCLSNFVCPRVLGTWETFNKQFANQLKIGTDSTAGEVGRMKAAANLIREKFEEFAQYRNTNRDSLPPNVDRVVYLQLSPLQRELYSNLMATCVKGNVFVNALNALNLCLKISGHPDILYAYLKKIADSPDEDDKLQKSEATPSSLSQSFEGGSSTDCSTSISPSSSPECRPRKKKKKMTSVLPMITKLHARKLLAGMFSFNWQLFQPNAERITHISLLQVP